MLRVHTMATFIYVSVLFLVEAIYYESYERNLAESFRGYL